MGIGKWDHIKAMLELPEVHAQFMALHEREPDDSDVDRIYNTFLPMQNERVGEFSAAIPGARETLGTSPRSENWLLLRLPASGAGQPAATRTPPASAGGLPRRF